MSIKTKMTILLLVVFVICGASVGFIFHYFFLQSFRGLETRARVEDMERVRNAIGREVEHLATLAWDWSAWDDTYEYVESPGADYEEANLVDATFMDNHLDLIYICDKSGRVVYGRVLDTEQEADVSLSDFPAGRLPPDHPLFIPESEAAFQLSKKSGLMLTEKGLMLAASSPVLSSSNQGPMRGFLIMGTFFNEGFKNKISEQTRVDFEAIPGRSPVPLTGPETEGIATREGLYSLTRDSDSLLTVHTVLKGVDGSPVLNLSARFPRDVIAQGRRTIRWAFSASLICIALCFLLAYLMVRRLVLSPLGRLAGHAHQLRKGGDLGSRLAMKRRDEVGKLAWEFDGLMEEIQGKERRLFASNAALGRDIEKRHQAEEALRKSEQYFYSLLRSMRDEILVVDASGVVQDANREDLELFGTTRRKALGRDCRELLSPYLHNGDGGGQACDFTQVFADGGPLMRRLRKKDEEGEVVLDMLVSPVMEEEGRVSHLILAFRDVSREARLTERLSEGQKMEAVATFAGGVAHDFNNILMSMMLNIEYVQKKTEAGTPMEEALSHAYEAGQKASGLIGQLLAFARGGGSLPRPFSLTPLMKETLKSIQASLPASVSFSVNIKARRDTVIATPAQIQTLLVNLCANSVHAIGGNPGLMGVKMENPARRPPEEIMPQGGFDPERWISITVSDSGCGMPEHVKARIFDPFFTTKGPGSGAGLGLSVVHGIVKSQNGFVSVSSEPGKGTELSLWLPVVEEGGLKASDSSRGKGPIRVLLADAEAYVARTLAAQLRELGLEVTETADSAKALDIFAGRPAEFDVAVVDRAVPGASGLSLAACIHKIRQDLPVFLTTGFSDSNSGGNDKDPNIKGILRRPVVAASLYAKILELFDKKGV